MYQKFKMVLSATGMMLALSLVSDALGGFEWLQRLLTGDMDAWLGPIWWAVLCCVLVLLVPAIGMGDAPAGSLRHKTLWLWSRLVSHSISADSGTQRKVKTRFALAGGVVAILSAVAALPTIDGVLYWIATAAYAAVGAVAGLLLGYLLYGWSELLGLTVRETEDGFIIESSPDEADGGDVDD